MDTKVPLTVVLEKETKLMNRLRQMSYVDEKKDVTYVTPLAWVVGNGYIPRHQDTTLENGVYVLKNWKQGDLYMGSRHWEREGLSGFPTDLDYCSMTGEDLEYDSLSWQAAKDIIQLAPNKLMKITQMIYGECEKVYLMNNYPNSDKGVFGPLIRVQGVLIATQRRIIAASDKLRQALETLVTNIPSNMEKLRVQELLMKDLVRLHERSRMLPQGSKEDEWSMQLIKNMLLASSAERFPNYATSSNVANKLMELQRNKKSSGNPLTLAITWDEIRSAFIEVNSGGVENFDLLLMELSDAPATRVMAAQVRQPLADRNGRGLHHNDKIEDDEVQKLRKENKDLRNTNDQLRATEQFHKERRQKNWAKRQPPHGARDASPVRKRVQAPAASTTGRPGPAQKAEGRANMLRTAPEDSDEEVSYERACCVRIMPANVEQSRIEHPTGREPAKNNETGNLSSIDKPSIDEETIPELVYESDDEADKVLTRITPEMRRNPKFHLVPYGNKLPRTISTAVARIHDESIPCTAWMNRKYEMPEDLPRLVLDEKEPWVPSYKSPDNMPQRGSIHYTVKEDDKVYLDPRIDVYYLERDGAWHPFDALMRGPIRTPGQHIMELKAMTFDTTAEDEERRWQVFCEDKVNQMCRLTFTMRMVNSYVDVDYSGERTVSICTINKVGSESSDPCHIYGSQDEYDRYAANCWDVTDCGWVTYVAQQCQINHEEHMYQFSKTFAGEENHLANMYTSPEYWIDFYHQEQRINHQLQFETNLLKDVVTGTITLAYAISMIGKIRKDFKTKSGQFFYPKLPQRDINLLHSRIMSVPNILDPIYLCSPVPGQRFTNEFGGPPDWVVLPEGDTDHRASTTVTATTRLPIPEGCFRTDASATGNGQSGMEPGRSGV